MQAFWQHPEIFIVYVACPRGHADEFLFPLDQTFIATFLRKKFDT
jgi:hypothetical protein